MPFQQQTETDRVSVTNPEHQFGISFQGEGRRHICSNTIVYRRLRRFERLHWIVRNHSRFKDRSINSRIASFGGRFRRKTAYICSVIGISIPCLRDRSTAA